jgi:hypothetical protein
VTTFRDGERGDRQLLQGFRCTRPPRTAADGHRLPHPRPWEAEIEAHFHNLKPPGRAEDLIRLGLDDNDDIASIVEVQHLKPATPSGTPEYFIRALAVALAHRGHGGATADAAMTDALRTLALRVTSNEHDAFIIAGRIHAANAASQNMATRHGMTVRTAATRADPYSLWAMLVAIDDAATQCR